MMKNIIVIVFVSILKILFALETKHLFLVVLSQNNDYNLQLVKDLKNDLWNQSNYLNFTIPQIYISISNITADWTIFPLILPSLEIAGSQVKWIIFLEDRTKVFLNLLLEELGKFNHNEDLWIGHTLHDSEATIIHHFAFFKDPTFFKYPNLGSGMALSVPLMNRLKSRIFKKDYKTTDFHIDPGYEFSLFVWDDGRGVMLQHESAFCTKSMPKCATFPKKFQPCGQSDASAIYFAVKTCHKFHKDRVPVVRSTWGQHASKITLFSDLEDAAIPTVNLGIENTEKGHCEKTMTILKYVFAKIKNDETTKWVALVDDDTILSVSRMGDLTSCHPTSQPLILGERYRFSGAGQQGFDYATGGSGILINRAALARLTARCKCPRIDAPDDMVLGACAEDVGAILVHVPQMHQARPVDYALGRLATDDAISFHKYWMIQPLEMYRHWLESRDKTIDNKIYKKIEL